MPTEARFAKVPPFPDDVPVAPLPIVSLAKLIAGNDSQSKSLFCACNAHGFFLLDVRDVPSGKSFLEAADAMFDINEAVHNMSPGDRDQYLWSPPHSLFGYKPVGSTLIESGQKDRYAFYNISHDDMIGNVPPRSNPPVVEDARKSIASYIKQCRSIIEIIVSHLERHLKLPPGTLLSLQDPKGVSGTALRLLCYEPYPEAERQTNLMGHTDIGSITVLFNVMGGLQILPAGKEPTEGNWQYVKPQPGCAIVSLGDAMVEWTGGVLRSNMHRVVPAPGEQAGCRRFSCAYLVRAQAQAPMRRIELGNMIPRLSKEEKHNEFNAKDWESHKAKAIQQGKDNARSRGGAQIDVC